MFQVNQNADINNFIDNPYLKYFKFRKSNHINLK